MARFALLRGRREKARRKRAVKPRRFSTKAVFSGLTITDHSDMVNDTHLRLNAGAVRPGISREVIASV